MVLSAAVFGPNVFVRGPGFDAVCGRHGATRSLVARTRWTHVLALGLQAFSQRRTTSELLRSAGATGRFLCTGRRSSSRRIIRAARFVEGALALFQRCDVSC